MNPPNDYDDAEWGKYQRLVLASLERLERQSEDHYAAIADFKEKCAIDFTEVKSDIKALKVMSGVLGTVSGAVSGALSSLAMLLRKG